MKYLLKFIFPFLRSGVDDKREFCHSTRNASSTRGTECLTTRFSLPTLQSAGYSVKLSYIMMVSHVCNRMSFNFTHFYILFCIHFQYGTIMWRIEWTARELSSRGGGQTINKARGKAMRITACILLAAALCRIPYTILVYWRSNLKKEINAVNNLVLIIIG